MLEISLAIGLEDVAVESLVPRHLQDVAADEFLRRFGESDAALSERREGAAVRPPPSSPEARPAELIVTFLSDATILLPGLWAGGGHTCLV